MTYPLLYLAGLQGRCFQSSLEEFQGGDASRLLYGEENGALSISTHLEDNPWWKIDLLEIADILAIRVFAFDRSFPYENTATMQDRVGGLEVAVSTDGTYWEQVYCGSAIRDSDQRRFGGKFSCPLTLVLGRRKVKQIRLSLPDRGRLQLNYLELVAVAETESATQAVESLLRFAGKDIGEEAIELLTTIAPDPRLIEILAAPQSTGLDPRSLAVALTFLDRVGAEPQRIDLTAAYARANMLPDPNTLARLQGEPRAEDTTRRRRPDLTRFEVAIRLASESDVRTGTFPGIEMRLLPKVAHFDEGGEELRLFRFSDATMLPHGGILSDGVSTDDLFFPGWLPWRNGLPPWHNSLLEVMPEHSAEFVRCVALGRRQQVSGSGFLFNAPWTLGNFGHFCHDMLFSAIFVDYLKAQGRNDLLFFVPPVSGLSGLRYPMQKLLFEALIGPTEQIRVYDGILAADEVFVPDPVFWFGADRQLLARRAARYLWSKVRRAFSDVASPSSPPRRIYISRKDGRRPRDLDNQSDVAAILRSYGFEEVILSSLTPRQLLELFYNADAIAGVHGAGLMNMLFSDPDRIKVIEFNTEPSSWGGTRYLAQGLGIDFTRVSATAGAPDRAGFANIDELRKALSGLSKPSRG